MNQWFGYLAYPLLTLLSTIYVQNCGKRRGGRQKLLKNHMQTGITGALPPGCLFFAQGNFVLLNQGLCASRAALRTILSTEYMQNWAQTLLLFAGIYRHMLVDSCDIFGLEN